MSMSMSSFDSSLSLADQVESATHELLNGSPNWSANLQLADLCNQQPANAYQIVAALKKRLSHKKHSIGLLAIILLESLLKNASRNLLPIIATQSFMDDLVHILPKQIRDPHNRSLWRFKDYTREILAVERYDKILLFIETTAKTFSTKYPIFGEIHRQLQRSGTHFPALERDELAPVVTPPMSQRVLAEKEIERQRTLQLIRASEERREWELAQAKRRDLEASIKHFKDVEARSAIETSNLLCDTLSETPEGTDLRRHELITQIWDALKPQARRLQERLQKLAAAGDEQLLAEILLANDVCMDAGLYYEGLVNGTMKRRPVVPPASSVEVAHVPATAAPRSRRGSREKASLPPSVSSSSSSHAASRTPQQTSPVERKVAIPLLEPPPSLSSTPRKRHSASGSGLTVPVATSSSSSSSSSSASSNGTVHIPEPTVDLLFASPQPPQPTQAQPYAPPSNSSFFVPPPPTVYSNALYQTPFQAQPQSQPPPPVSHPSASSSSIGGLIEPSQSSLSDYDHQVHLIRQARVNKGLPLSPPPQATGNVDFFLKTPFDDSPQPPQLDDPFLQLATRTSPHAASGPSIGSGPSSYQSNQRNQHRPSAEQKSVVEQFDLLTF